MALNKRTPCVGICSTTYGDLVCRGCKRFAHEIVQWNGYDEAQQARIWQRLRQLRDEVVLQRVVVTDGEAFARVSAEPAHAELSGGELLYTVIQKLGVAGRALSDAGLADAAGLDADALAILKALDQEIYNRSQAHYERNFKVPV